jgi:hypothetical protein
MRVGIDWVSLAIFVAAYAFSQLRTVPAPVRYGVLSAACAAIGVYRLRTGGSALGQNMLFVLLAGALAVFYAVRAFQSRAR